MTRKQSIPALAVAVVVGVAACVVLWNDYRDAEMKLYVAYLQSLNAEPAMKDIAFMSQVWSCGASVDRVPAEYAEALRDMLRANGPDAIPRRFEKLAQLANVVRYEEAQRLHALRYQEPSFARTRVIGLSRAGFNPGRDRAVLCVQPGHGRALAYFQKADGPFWRLVNQEYLVVQ
ncbi:hypothetical protein [Solimonas sp. SE-A11]|uniref:hypothetical protein n=1 Tax=Solimonas sp. SE-A11 TaxID=3054954 RepID=UPI00259C9E03|nr:hypothetical protein [Solimonas sp. SE-A11]MDM4769204.1 hypothetical protein [Solimonas sp. SE-A11]